MTSVDVLALPVSDKLKLMETLWDALCLESHGNLDSPDWHTEVLEQRLRLLASGSDVTTPWPEAKDRIRAQTKPC